MATPANCKFTKEHEWIRMENGEALVGISHYAQEELGDITFVETPEPDAEFEKGDTMATVESVKAASDIYAPISGRIVAVNESLQDKPELINESPWEEGWIARIAPSNPAELDDLMNAEAYDKYAEGLEH